MKIQYPRRSRGFTLVELLVVIAIIAVLAAAGFGGVQFALNKAKKMKALAAATAINSAVNDFYTEYGRLPIDGDTDVEVLTNSAEGQELLEVLLGMNTEENPRGIRFLNVQEGKANKDGLIYGQDGTSVVGLYDPWGGSYKVKLDLDYNEELDVEPKAGVSKTLRGRRVATWSDGADGVSGQGEAPDDVLTW